MLSTKEACVIKRRVLIVDDETAFLLAIKRLLTGPDISIDTAATLDDAIALLHSADFNAVITDIRLTNVLGMEGLEILRYVKEHSPGTVVVILTGYGNTGIMETAYNMGANVYLEKPVPPNILKNVLENSWRN